MIDEHKAAVEIFCVKLGTNLRLVRLRRLMTVEDVAEQTGISPQLVRQLEHGDWQNAGLHAVANVAFALDVELELQLRDRPQTGEAAC